MSCILKDLSDIRGEKIEFLPNEDYCEEVVDAELIAKRPLVSVHMMTYNHEMYVGKAIESVLAQKVDFEYEILIGEDCSSDATREICRSYQKKYPDKIRLFLSKQNVGIGINTRRLFIACRGKYVAYLEGDDYWIDDLKLAKQVAIMDNLSNVGLIFCGAKIYHQENDKWSNFDDNYVFGTTSCLIPKNKFLAWTLYGKNARKVAGDEFFVMTSGLFFRNSAMQYAINNFEVFNWRLGLYDSAIVLSMASSGDVYYLYDQVSVYRQLSSGLTVSKLATMVRDTLIIRFYFHMKLFCLPLASYPSKMMDRFAFWMLAINIGMRRRSEWYKYVNAMLSNKRLRFFLLSPRRWIVWFCLLFDLKTFHSLGYYYMKMWPPSCPREILTLYR